MRVVVVVVLVGVAIGVVVVVLETVGVLLEVVVGAVTLDVVLYMLAVMIEVVVLIAGVVFVMPEIRTCGQTKGRIKSLPLLRYMGTESDMRRLVLHCCQSASCSSGLLFNTW